MKESTPAPDRSTVVAAAGWYLRLQATDVNETERTACLDWRREHATHELAWQRLETLWGRFDALPPRPARRALRAALRPRVLKAGIAATGTLALLLGCAAMLGLHRITPVHLLADHRTGIGETRSIELPDRSRIVLDAESTVDVQYGPMQRRVILHRGTVLVEVAPDAQRPFVVETTQGSARALGTRYLVQRLDADAATRVTVLESRVQACAPRTTASSPRCRELAPDQQLELHADGVGAIRAVDADASVAWLQGQLVLDDTPLPEVLQALQTRRIGRLRFDTQALSQVRVSGVLPLDDSDRALDILQETLPIHVERRLPWIATVHPRTSH